MFEIQVNLISGKPTAMTKRTIPLNVRDYLKVYPSTTFLTESTSSYFPTSGIREHACEILDGGADAFAERKDKYRV